MITRWMTKDEKWPEYRYHTDDYRGIFSFPARLTQDEWDTFDRLRTELGVYEDRLTDQFEMYREIVK